LVLLSLLAVAACGSGTGTSDRTTTLRLGYFPNLTHAPAILGLAGNIFERELGSNVELETRTFAAGPAATEALFAGAIDVTYIGPNPAINAFQKSGGEAVRVIAGSTSGGAALVVSPKITKPQQLRGKKLATPQFGNTQDVALRAWLKDEGLATTKEGGGDVAILPQDNAQTLETFRQGKIDGAWVPEPWASRLVIEGGGKILVDEKDRWPDKKYTTTLLVVRTEYLLEHDDAIRKLLAAHLKAIDAAIADPAASQRKVNSAIEEVTGKALEPEVLESAWSRLVFTYDPLLMTLERSAAAAKELGFLTTDDIRHIDDLAILNEELREQGKDLVL
jgi:NitT/TauT family transport system substrate-binding protein